MKTLVFLPGWITEGKTYKKFVKLAPKDYQIFIPGYKVLAPKGDLTNFKQKLIGYLKHNNLSKIELVGYSLGGGLALDFARTYPEIVEKLYLVDPKAIYDQKSIIREMYQVASELMVTGVRFLPCYLLCGIKLLSNFPVHLRTGHYSRELNLENEATQIKVPTVIFWGEKDPTIPLWQGEKLHKLIPGSKLIVLKNLGHSWIVYFPEKFWENMT